MSEYRDDRPLCLDCGSGLVHVELGWSCEQCHSVLVAAERVEAMMNEASPDDQRPIDRRLIPAPSSRPRACPQCRAEMAAFELHGVTVDRCVAHGLWFDGAELWEAHNANAAAYNARHSRVPRGAAIPLGIGIIVGALLSPWLDRRRLERDIARTSPPDPGDKPR